MLESEPTNCCYRHRKFVANCHNCIATLNIDPENYFESWIEAYGERLGCGNQPGFVFAAIDDMIQREESMKKMIAKLRQRNKDDESETTSGS